jgi:glycosyltransferase involved in cell wall biosynthesis
VFTQDREVGRTLAGVEVHFRGPVESRWEMYQDQHLMVLPRRYGGLSLKVHESLDSGVPVIMPDIEPNRRWPGPRTPAARGKRILVPCGPLHTFNADPHAIAAEIDLLARDRSLLEVEQRAALKWAEENSWSHLRHAYMKAFKGLLA